MKLNMLIIKTDQKKIYKRDEEVFYVIFLAVAVVQQYSSEFNCKRNPQSCPRHLFDFNKLFKTELTLEHT